MEKNIKKFIKKSIVLLCSGCLLWTCGCGTGKSVDEGEERMEESDIASKKELTSWGFSFNGKKYDFSTEITTLMDQMNQNDVWLLDMISLGSYGEGGNLLINGKGHIIEVDSKKENAVVMVETNKVEELPTSLRDNILAGTVSFSFYCNDEEIMKDFRLGNIITTPFTTLGSFYGMDEDEWKEWIEDFDRDDDGRDRLYQKLESRCTIKGAKLSPLQSYLCLVFYDRQRVDFDEYKVSDLESFLNHEDSEVNSLGLRLLNYRAEATRMGLDPEKNNYDLYLDYPARLQFVIEQEAVIKNAIQHGFDKLLSGEIEKMYIISIVDGRFQITIVPRDAKALVREENVKDFTHTWR